MHKRFYLRWLIILGILLPALTGCGGSDGPVFVEPGLIGIDDRPAVAITAPELTVEYALPGFPGTTVVSILSDQPTDGHIAFDPFLNSFTITNGPDTLLFGVDSADPNEPEFRAFLDFPLNGSTGGPTIPLNAIIVAADLTVFVNSVEFASRIPVLVDLVEYSVLTGPTESDYFPPPLAVQTVNFFSSDEGFDVVIDVTSLMSAAQNFGLLDFQVRLLVEP